MIDTKQDDGLPQVRYFDYKNVETLQKFVNPHGRIIGRKYTKLSAGGQRKLARAVKNSRFMGFMPYTIK